MNYTSLENGLYTYFNLCFDTEVEEVSIYEDTNYDKSKYCVELYCAGGMDEYKRIVQRCKHILDTSIIVLEYHESIDDLYIYCHCIRSESLNNLYMKLKEAGIKITIPRNLNMV